MITSATIFTIKPTIGPTRKIGSSPLTRGTLIVGWSTNHQTRFIPAYAGNSVCVRHQRPFTTVHPRLRGELFRFDIANRDTLRFIPAYAGNSSTGYGVSVTFPVHPRLRGELGMAAKIAAATAGSSPLTRGTHSANWRWKLYRRFIPAYAGNSKRRSAHRFLCAVHPRLRGELFTGYRRDFGRNRFIPAYAGNSSAFIIAALASAVHPRLRGELSVFKYINSGKQRFIPAYAGNSLKQGIEHLTNSSKDFLSGKYAKNPETVLNHFKNSSLD